MGPAILGTLLVTGGATLIAVPLGILGAIYLNEYGGTSKFARAVRFMAMVMTGVPSVVMGLFVYVMWTMNFGYSAFGSPHTSTTQSNMELLIDPLPYVATAAT